MAATVEDSGTTTTGISSLHIDILETHILTRLDGPTLAAASCASSAVNSISGQQYLWSKICHSTWPSTSTPRVSDIISGFPEGGPRSFFSQSFSLPGSAKISRNPKLSTAELISAVDIYYKNELIFTKVEETETVTGWFRCSPFRIDLLDPKDVVQTAIKYPDGEDSCGCLMDDITLSWILIDPTRKQSVNLTSHKPVSVQRHWLSGEIQVRFASILAVGSTSSSGYVQCGVVVNFGGSEGGEMQVREVSMQVEDMDGKNLNGKDSLVIVEKVLEGKRGKGVKREEEARRRYKEFLEMKKERKERKVRIEGVLDTLSVVFGVTIFAACWLFVLC